MSSTALWVPKYLVRPEMTTGSLAWEKRIFVFSPATSSSSPIPSLEKEVKLQRVAKSISWFRLGRRKSSGYGWGVIIRPRILNYSWKVPKQSQRLNWYAWDAEGPKGRKPLSLQGVILECLHLWYYQYLWSAEIKQFQQDFCLHDDHNKPESGALNGQESELPTNPKTLPGQVILLPIQTVLTAYPLAVFCGDRN